MSKILENLLSVIRRRKNVFWKIFSISINFTICETIDKTAELLVEAAEGKKKQYK